MHWFFNREIQGQTFNTAPEESRHISKVLRMVPGDQAFFTDGVGNLYYCELLDNHPKHCSFRVTKKESIATGKNYHLHVAVAPTKNISRFEWFLEKATEIGIDEITPIICDHSERAKLKTERLDKIMISALKQSQQVWLPVINEAVRFKNFIENPHESHLNYIAWVSPEHNKLLKDKYEKGGDTLIMIGPEGDFSPTEIKSALDLGFQPISLGQNRLRTETAALVACFTVVNLNQ